MKKSIICPLVLLAMLGIGGIAPLRATAIAQAVEHDAQSIAVTGIADVYGDGEKISVAVLAYPKEIDAHSVSAEDFAVEGKTIEAVYVSDKPEIPVQSLNGKYVILKFAYQNTSNDATLIKKPGKEKHGDKMQGMDAPSRSDRQPPDLSLRVQQTGILRGVDGAIFPPRSEELSSTVTKEPIIDSFEQHIYTDEKTGISMPYNLYLPQGYDPSKKYPLLFFVADASANINHVKTPLFQGNGATVWATPEEQAKHECIVLAPQYTADLVQSIGMMTTDANEWTPGLSLITNLLFDCIHRYSVDENRIYGTGQSQGGMTNIAISDKYPDLFAGQLLVACQWNVDEMEAMKDKNLWIVVCEGDTKAFPGMNAATERWESLGSKVARNAPFLNSKASAEEIAAAVEALEKQGAHIHYSVFQGGNHMYTWSFAYNIEPIRDWLFRQTKQQ